MLSRTLTQLSRVRRTSVSDLVDVAGLGCLVAAAWWWLPIVGLVALGLALLLAGWALDR